MATRLFLIRHGETDYGRQKKYSGFTDVPLNSRGIAQAKRLLQRLADQAIDAIYASPLQRAYDTARLVFENRPQTVQRLADLKEIHFGLWEGLTNEDVMAHYPEVYRQWLEAPESVAIPGG